MFTLRTDPYNCVVTGDSARLFGGAMLPLPPALAALARLGHTPQQYAALRAIGLSEHNIDTLLDLRLLRFGRGEDDFPQSARAFFEEQFPRNASARPLAHWCSMEAPAVVWIGLPLSNLMSIRHSTALGLAAVLDALPLEHDYFLAVLPYTAPCVRMDEDIEAMVRVIAGANGRMGWLGGDHRVAWAFLRALKLCHPAGHVRYVHIDAHHDLYGVERGEDPPVIAHSNFLISLLHNRQVDEAILIGCRDRQAPIHSAQEQGFDVTLLEEAADYRSLGPHPERHCHLSIDLDVLDPGVAASVTSPIPQGWTEHALKRAVTHLVESENFDSFSIVEVCQGCAELARIAGDLIRICTQGASRWPRV